jgi:hypothetical protein
MEVTSNVKRVAGAGSIMLAALAVGVPTASATSGAPSPTTIVCTVVRTPAPDVAVEKLSNALNLVFDSKCGG